jgi:hypothetical protein
VSENKFQDAFGDDESLAVFLRQIKRFEEQFCEVMASGIEFTLRMEIHGNKCGLLHARVQNDSFDRPRDVPKREGKKNR